MCEARIFSLGEKKNSTLEVRNDLVDSFNLMLCRPTGRLIRAEPQAHNKRSIESPLVSSRPIALFDLTSGQLTWAHSGQRVYGGTRQMNSFTETTRGGESQTKCQSLETCNDRDE